MAEGILKASIARERAGEIRVGSAGTAGIVGRPATALAKEVSAEHGIDISEHRSSGFDRSTADSADVILAMTRGHVDEILEVAPQAREKTFLLSEFADGSDVDVPDPIGGPKEEYERVFDMLAGYVEKALPKLIELERGGDA